MSGRLLTIGSGNVDSTCCEKRAACIRFFHQRSLSVAKRLFRCKMRTCNEIDLLIFIDDMHGMLNAYQTTQVATPSAITLNTLSDCFVFLHMRIYFAFRCCWFCFAWQRIFWIMRSMCFLFNFKINFNVMKCLSAFLDFIQYKTNRFR